MRFLSLLILMGSAVPGPPKWETYKPKNDDFTISFPGHPSEESQPTPLGTTIYTAIVKTDKGAVYSIAYGESGLKGNPTEANKISFFEGAVEASKGTILSQKQLSMNGHPGRDYLIKIGDNAFMRMQMYLVNNRSYTLIVVGRDEAALKSEEAVQFLSSFTFPQGLPPVAASAPVPPPAAPAPRTERLAEIAGGVFVVVFVILLLAKLGRKKKPEIKEGT
jgi:hypothetical protein